MMFSSQNDSVETLLIVWQLCWLCYIQ